MREAGVLIIGAGISGLSTAWWLARQGIEVDLWEAAPAPGGLIRSTREDGYLTESAAGLLVNFRPEVDRLIQQCDLQAAKLQRPDDLQRYVLHQQQLAVVPMTFSGIARSALWSRQSKLRLLGEILVRGSGPPGESVAQFIRRRFGREILDSAIDPFVSATLACDPELAEAVSVLPRLKALEQQYGSITMGILATRIWKRRRINRADTFSFQQGLSQLVEAMAATPGIRLHNQVRVRQLTRGKSAWRVVADTPSGELQQECRQLVLAPSADISAGLLTEIDSELCQLLQGIQYAPLAVLHMGFARSRIAHPLDGTGFLVGQRQRLSINGNLWMSSLFPQRAPAGKCLLSSYLGGSRHPDYLQLSDERLRERAVADLAPLLGISGEPEYVRIDRHPRGLPQYHGGYQAKLEQITRRVARHPGLHLCGNYAGGISVRERIYQGRILAGRIFGSLDKPSREAGLLNDQDPTPAIQAF